MWGATTDIYKRGGTGTAWSAADLTDWTPNTVGTIEIDNGLKTSGGNASYEYQKALTINPAAKLTITGTWNTGSSLGRDAAYNYLQFGTVELRAYGQAQRGTIVINGEETELTTSGGDVRNDQDWIFSIIITQATGDVSYTITPPSGAKSGTGNAGVLDFSAIKMGYLKTGSLVSTHQTLKAISITEELYAYTVNATGSLNREIASGSDGPSASLTIPYHRYILSGTTLHKADKQGSNPHYGVIFTLDEDNKQVNIGYTNPDPATNVAVFREAEDFMTEANNSYVNIRCSNQLGGYSSTAKTVASLPKGAYTITAASYGRPTNFVFSSGGADKWTHSASAWGENTSGIVQLAEGDLQVRGGSSSYALDYVYVTRVFAFEEASSGRDMSSSTTGKPTLVNTLTGYTVTYSSSNPQVATVNATGDVTFLHNGTAVITATATKADSPTYTTSHTVNITGENNATATWNTSVANQETYTLSGTGYIDQTAEGTLVTMSYGSASETQTVTDGKAHCIDAYGYYHVFLNASGVPTMGTYYAFTPKVNGTLTINALVSEDGDKGRNGLRLVDSDGNILERFTSIGADYQNYAFNTLLIAGRTYYVFAETGAMETKLDDDAYSTLWLHSFTFTQMEGTTISLIDQSLLFTPNNNANSQRLDRTIPGFNITFGGGDGAKYNGGGTFIFRNRAASSDEQNGSITITPRIKTGNASDVTITSVTLNTGATVVGTPHVKINGTQKADAITANSTQTFSGLTGNTLTIQLAKTGEVDAYSFLLNSLTILYSLNNDATLDNAPVDNYVKLKFANDYIYDYEGTTPNCDVYFDTPVAFYGDVNFTYSNSTFGSGCTNAVTKYKNSDEKIHLNDGNTNNPYKVRIGQGVSTLTASFAATDYFAASTATTRLYSRDYEETPAKVLAAGDSYTWPAGNDMTFEITTTEAGTITLNGGDNIAMTAGGTYTYTVASAEDKVVVTNAGSSAITISKVKTYRKSATLDFGYAGAVGAGSDVLFTSWSYTPNTFTITSETETGIASKYATTGTYAITQEVTGVSINESTGVITVADGAANGVLKVTLTVNPLEAHKADYAPITKTIELKVVDGMWDFRTYSQAEHSTMYNSTGWSGSAGGWYAARDNAEFADILRNDNTPLPRALALQSMGKHRLLHTDHGYLHLQGKGTGVNESSNGGGQVRVPVKAGMLVEVNSYSEDNLSEMEIDGVTDLEDNDVTVFYVNPQPAESQYFLAKSDGYIIVRNPSTNLDLHICYIKVSADMAFEYGEKDESGNIVTYVDASVGTWTNPVMNQGTTTITYSYTNNISTPVSEIASATGEVTLGGAYGKFTINADGSGTGLLAGKTGSYIAYAVGFTTTDLSRTISESHEFDLKDRISIAVGTITDTESSVTEANLKEKVTFSLVNASPSVTLDGSTLTISEVGTVTVKATLGAIEKTFTCTLNGGTLADGLNPVIENDATSYTITLTGGTAHKFKLKDMYDAILGDLKADKSSLVFKNVDNPESPVTLNVTTAEVSCSKLLIEGFSTIKKGGVIPIYASYEYSSTTYNIEGTLTVAYTSHVWRFQHNLLTGLDTTGETEEGLTSGYGSAHGLTGGLSGWLTANGSKTAAWSSTYATIDQPTDDGTRHDDYNWKFVRKILGRTNSSIVYYYNHAVEGQNALVIPETEGLHLFSTPSNKQLGVEMMHTDGVANVPYDCRNLMLLRGGKFTIPKLKKGQWVEVRWSRHNPDMGERILMTNLSDAEGTPITSTYKIGNCFYNLGWSTSSYMFQTTADGDVTFEVADNIYVTIHEIILHEPGWTFQSNFADKLRGYDDQHTPDDATKEAWTGETADQLDWQYIWDDQGSHTITILQKHYQNAPNAPQLWTFEMDDMLKRSGATMVATGEMDQEATITYNGGWGKVKVTMTSYSQNMKYVANKKSWTITFGQAPKQTYPYTWDFTKFFSSTLGSTTNENTWAAVAYSGDTKPLRVAIYNNHSSSNYGSGGWPNSYNMADYDSYYVEGAQLVSYGLRNTNNGVLRETAGLGFILDTDADGQPDQNMLMLNMTNTVGTAQQTVNGQTWITDTGESDAAKHTGNSHLTIGSGGKVIVPKPNDDVNFANYYIYIRSSHEPSAYTNVKKMVAESAGVDEAVDANYDVPTGVYKYQFSANANAVFTFTSDDEATDDQLGVYTTNAEPDSYRKYTDIYAIAVTKDFKTMKRLNGVGWATESRNHAVDYTLDSLLTNRPMQAYSVIARSSNPIYSDDKAKTTVRLQDRNYVVPAEQGLVLKQVTGSPGDDGDTYTVPLFVPAITTAADNDYAFTNNLMRKNLSKRTFREECEDADGTDNASGAYTRFILSEKYMTWRKENATVTYDEHFTSGTVPGFYRLHLYGNASYDGGTERNKLGANKAYLVLPSDKINNPIWNPESTPAPAPYRDFIGIAGISDMEDIQTVTNEIQGDGRTYNLKGQVVSDEGQLTPGIYIRNGKKIVVK